MTYVEVYSQVNITIIQVGVPGPPDPLTGDQEILFQVYICICIHKYAYVYMWLYVFIYIYIYICMYVFLIFLIQICLWTYLKQIT
jgi:hypothetical protein